MTGIVACICAFFIFAGLFTMYKFGKDNPNKGMQLLVTGFIILFIWYGVGTAIFSGGHSAFDGLPFVSGIKKYGSLKKIIFYDKLGFVINYLHLMFFLILEKMIVGFFSKLLRHFVGGGVGGRIVLAIVFSVLGIYVDLTIVSFINRSKAIKIIVFILGALFFVFIFGSLIATVLNIVGGTKLKEKTEGYINGLKDFFSIGIGRIIVTSIFYTTILVIILSNVTTGGRKQFSLLTGGIKSILTDVGAGMLMIFGIYIMIKAMLKK